MRNLALFSVCFAAACASHPAGPEVLPDLKVPPAPAPDKGWQIITPIVENLAPSSDTEMCTWTNVFVPDSGSVDVKSVIGAQNEPPGHHIVVYYTMNHQIPGTQRVCMDSDMVTFRFTVATGGEGTPSEAPGNLVFRIPPGAQIVINHHYLNATDSTLRGQSAINVNFAEPGNWTPVGYLMTADTNIQVPPGQSTWDIHCVLQQTMKLWQQFPHMHQWGSHATLKLTQAGVQSTVFDGDWAPSMTFHPPVTQFDPATPKILSPGDAIDMHCAWNNTTPNTLTFGLEMCVAFGATVDDSNQGAWACDAGQWGQF